MEKSFQNKFIAVMVILVAISVGYLIFGGKNAPKGPAVTTVEKVK